MYVAKTELAPDSPMPKEPMIDIMKQSGSLRTALDQPTQRAYDCKAQQEIADQQHLNEETLVETTIVELDFFKGISVKALDNAAQCRLSNCKLRDEDLDNIAMQWNPSTCNPHFIKHK